MKKRDSLYKHRWWLTLPLLFLLAAVIYCAACLILNMIVLLFKFAVPVILAQESTSAFTLQGVYIVLPPEPVKPYYVALIACLLSIPIGLPLIRRIQQKLFPDTTIEGESRWATKHELKAEFGTVPISAFKSPANDGAELDHAGLIVGGTESVYYTTNADVNTLVIGATRSGKTQRLLLPTFRMLIFERRSFIVNDMKGELIENLYKQLTKSGYRIRVLNLRQPQLGSGWDPLHTIKESYLKARRGEADLSEASEQISDLAYTLTENPRSDPVWPESARALLEAVIRYLLDDAYDNNRMERLNMYGVVNFYTANAAKNFVVKNQAINALDQIFVQLPDDHWAKQSYATCQLAAGDMLASIRATLSSNLSIFNDIALAQMTARDDIRFEELYDPETPTAIFVILPDEKTTRHKLMSLFVSQSYAALIGAAFRFPKQRLPRRVMYMIDEFGVLTTIRDIGVKLSACLSRGVSFYLCIQDQPQLEAKYGKEATKNIFNNCGYRMYVLASDPETNKYVSDMLGRRSVEYSTYMGESGAILNNRRNTHVKGRELKKTDELQRLQEGQIITMRLRGHPILSDLTPFYKFRFKVVPIGDMGLTAYAPIAPSDLVYPPRASAMAEIHTDTPPADLQDEAPVKAPVVPAEEAPTMSDAELAKARRDAVNACNLYSGGAFSRLLRASKSDAYALAERLLKEKKITSAQWDAIERMFKDAH